MPFKSCGCLEKALTQSQDTILVLEDDVIFPSDFRKQLEFYLNEVPKDFDILYLGGSNLKLKKYNQYFGKPVKTPPKKLTIQDVMQWLYVRNALNY